MGFLLSTRSGVQLLSALQLHLNAAQEVGVLLGRKSVLASSFCKPILLWWSHLVNSQVGERAVQILLVLVGVGVGQRGHIVLRLAVSDLLDQRPRQQGAMVLLQRPARHFATKKPTVG